VTIGAIFWIVLNAFDELLFFWPIVTFYLPSEKILGFILSNASAAMMGIVISMNVYALRNSGSFSRSLFSGSSLGIASCACVGCSSIGPALVSALGGVGAATLTLFVVYQIPLRVISLALLAWTFYSVQRTIKSRNDLTLNT
jgi:fucose 4-O-acetylase-like acetyltransferase